MRRPNILILHTDQQRWDALGASGNPEIRTPHLDRLAAGGINYRRCFVQNPVCMPSRESFYTGRYPHTLGITHMAVPLPEDAVTLPGLLANVGYARGCLGKLHFLPHANRDHREPHPAYGFSHLEISDEPGCYEDAYRAWVRRTAPDQLDLISLGLPPATETWQKLMRIDDGIAHPEERFPMRALAFRGRSDVTHTAFVADRTMDFMRRHRDEPFLAVAGFYSPHSPWVAPQEFLDLYDPDALTLPTYPEEIADERAAKEHFSDATLRGAKHGYYAMVSEVDHHVGRILDTLDELGLADDTIVVFTSDHGEWLGDHLRYSKGYPAHDCVSGVPLIVRYPGGPVAAGGTSDALVEALDVLPTLLGWAGVPVPQHLQGRPLPNPGEPGRPSVLTEHTGWKGLRTERCRYIAHADGREHLFDLEAEFGEYRNVADVPAYGELLSDARHALVTHLLQAERPLPRVWPY